MPKYIKLLLVLIGMAVILYGNPAQAADIDCNDIRTGTKVWWDGAELRPGQIGRITVLNNAPLYKLNGEQLSYSRTLKAGEVYRVYAFKPGLLSVGGGLYVKRDTLIGYQTPSKMKLQIVACVYQKDTQLKNEAQQMIVVKKSSVKTAATLQTYQKQNGKWTQASSPVAAVIGKEGMGKTKEGDARTPYGTYKLGTSFGWGPKPSGMSYPFKAVTSQDYWVDDVSSADYNKWITYTGNPYARWKSFERMNHPLYKYGVVIRYNDNPIIKGEGSAIFLHIRTSGTAYTLGCVAIAEKELVKILQWLEPAKKPIIVME
mgnify:CR=1 FL=1